MRKKVLVLCVSAAAVAGFAPSAAMAGADIPSELNVCNGSPTISLPLVLPPSVITSVPGGQLPSTVDIPADVRGQIAAACQALVLHRPLDKNPYGFCAAVVNTLGFQDLGAYDAYSKCLAVTGGGPF
jgi:hypothetical protein